MGLEKCEELFLEGLLRSWEKAPELQLIEAESSPCCKSGDNYMSTITRVNLNVKKAQESEGRSVLLKRPPESQARREAFRCEPAFANEAAAYSRALPALRSFAGEPLPFPACLHASSSLIVLEDLKPQGFVMADRQRGLSLPEATMALQALGRLHGTSLAMKYEEPERWARAIGSVSELLYCEGEGSMFSCSLDWSIKMAVGALERTPGQEEIAKRLSRLEHTLYSTMAELVRPDTSLAALCHGDFWINNVLFKYSNGKPQSVMIVDMQVVRYGAAVTDVLHLLCTSLESGLRRSSWDALIKSYHDSLISTISRLSEGATKPSLSELMEDINRRRLYGLGIGLLLLPAITTTQAPDLDEACSGAGFDPDFVEKTYQALPPAYTERLIDIVSEFSEMKYI